MHLGVQLEAAAPEPSAVTQAVEIRFGRQLTRISDVLVVRSDQPGRHWFAPTEVLVAIEIESPGSHLEDHATEPFAVDVTIAELPPRWAGRGEGPTVPEQR